MAQQIINVDVPNSGNGDTLRNSQVKANSNFTELYANKVDKVVGKVLSDTNYTQAEKDQLAALVAAGPQTQTDWDQGDNTQRDYLKNKPENTSEFNNNGDGVNPFVTEVAAAGNYVRAIGGWVLVANTKVPKIQFVADGVQDTFDIGVSAEITAVAWNGVILNDDDWSQTGNEFTITFIPTLGDIIKPI